MNKYVIPSRIVCSDKTENEAALLKNKVLQVMNNSSKDCAVIKKGGFVLLDFGRELRGGIALTVYETSKNIECAKCRITFGESVMEALSSIGEKNATNQHSIRDTVIEVGFLTTQKYGATGFRFVKLEPIDADITISTVQAETDIKDVEYKGSFKCDDELLNKIWKTGAYTVHLNMGDFLWDGIKRDRLVWIGDINPEVAVINSVFGYDESVPNSLDLAKDSFPPDCWMNGIASYSIWWIINQYDWYMQHGDAEYLKNQLHYMAKLIDKVAKWIDNDYSTKTEFEKFVDWSSENSPGKIEGLKSVLCLGFDCAAKIFEQFNINEKSQLCRKYRDKLRLDISDTDVNKRVAALNILAGRNVEKSKFVLAGNSAEEMSCFMGYYVLLAKAKLNEFDDALDIIREYWGGMLKMGATSFWEDFDINWMNNSSGIDDVVPEGMKDIHGDFGRYCYEGFRHSLCHGWASGPTAYLSKYILGINVLEPGCKKVSIKPNLSDLKWVKGTYPTPFGNIEVSHKKENGKVISNITAPDEIEIVTE